MSKCRYITPSIIYPKEPSEAEYLIRLITLLKKHTQRFSRLIEFKIEVIGKYEYKTYRFDIVMFNNLTKKPLCIIELKRNEKSLNFKYARIQKENYEKFNLPLFYHYRESGNYGKLVSSLSKIIRQEFNWQHRDNQKRIIKEFKSRQPSADISFL